MERSKNADVEVSSTAVTWSTCIRKNRIIVEKRVCCSCGPCSVIHQLRRFSLLLERERESSGNVEYRGEVVLTLFVSGLWRCGLLLF